MVFHTVSAIAALLIFFGASGGKALAQYYPPAQAYPPPQAYPPEGYYPRQAYPPLPPVVDDDADDDMVYDLPDQLFRSFRHNAPSEKQSSFDRLPINGLAC